MTLYEAIFNRRSIRRYDFKPLPEQLLKKLNDYISDLNRMQADIAYQTNILEGPKARKQLSGIFRVKAPYYLLLLIEDKEGSTLEAGYLAEQIVLYLAGRGIGTCYQGAAKVSQKYIPEGYKLATIIAFGYAQGKVYRDASQAKRYPLSKLCLFRETPDEEIRTLLKAARLAPSAMNKQPWRFVAYEEKIHFYCKKDSGLLSRQLNAEFDIGVMLCHVMVAADEFWIEIELEHDGNEQERRMSRLKYFVSAKKMLDKN